MAEAQNREAPGLSRGSVTRLLINAAMVPNPGTFRYRQISADAAAQWLAVYGDIAVSYIGYPQTAEHLETLWCESQENNWMRGPDDPPLRVALNRAKTTMVAGDEALVCKLAYRVLDPATKGQPQSSDWEYGLLEMLADA